MNICDVINLSLYPCGCTEYCFRCINKHHLSSSAATAAVVKPCIDSKKGLGLFSTKAFKVGASVVASAVPIYYITNSLTTKQRPIRVCRCCLSVILKSAKVYEECPTELYCSAECLSKQQHYLDHCSTLINEVKQNYSSSSNRSNEQKNEFHSLEAMFILIIQLLYNYEVHQQQRFSEFFRRIFALHTNGSSRSSSVAEGTVEWELNQAADWFTARITAATTGSGEILIKNALKRLSSQFQMNHNTNGSNDINEGMMMGHLFHILRFNMQTLPYPSLHSELNGVMVSTILPLFARMNHSCAPNTLLTFKSIIIDDAAEQSTTTTALEVSIIATRDINANEELSISYIHQLHIQTCERQDILMQLSAFYCQCERCLHEVPTNDQRMNHPNIINMRQITPNGEEVMKWQEVLKGFDEYFHTLSPHQQYIDCSIAADIASIALLDARQSLQKSSLINTTSQSKLLMQCNALIIAIHSSSLLIKMKVLMGCTLTWDRINLMLHCGAYGQKLHALLPLLQESKDYSNFQKYIEAARSNLLEARDTLQYGNNTKLKGMERCDNVKCIRKYSKILINVHQQYVDTILKQITSLCNQY